MALSFGEVRFHSEGQEVPLGDLSNIQGNLGVRGKILFNDDSFGRLHAPDHHVIKLLIS